jgi:hypothetical protein
MLLLHKITRAKLKFILPVDELAETNNYQIQSSSNPTNGFSSIESLNETVTEINRVYSETENQSRYYRIVLLNQCGIIIDSSNVINSIWLQAQLNQGIVQLQWNMHEFFPNSLSEYQVYHNNELLGSVTTTEFEHNIEGDTTRLHAYQIIALENGVNPNTGIQGISSSNTVVIETESEFTFKEAYAPGPGEAIIGPEFVFEVSEYELQIFNKEGVRVAKLQNKKWDAHLPNKKRANPGTYIYHLRYTFNGKSYLRKGYFVLIQ